MRKTRKRACQNSNELRCDVVVEYAGVKSTFTPEDMKRLEHGAFLNENVIDFFLSKRALECVDAMTLEVCSTSFYRRLIIPKHLPHASNVPDHVNSALERVNFLGTQHLHPRFFSSTFSFVPVNVGEDHWVLAVVYHRNCPSVRRLGTIIVFDSHQTDDSTAQHVQIASMLRDFMNCHWCLKHEFGVMNPSKLYTADSCPLTVPNIVTQENGYDCGLYVIKSAEVVMNEGTVISDRCLLTADDLRWLEGYFLDKVVVDEKKGRADLRKEVKDMCKLSRV